MYISLLRFAASSIIQAPLSFAVHSSYHHTASSFPVFPSARPPILLLLPLWFLPLDLTKSFGPLVLQLGVEHVAAADGGDVVA